MLFVIGSRRVVIVLYSIYGLKLVFYHGDNVSRECQEVLKININKPYNRIVFGAPGTGKTEAVKQLARILNREIFMVDFSAIVDSKLGQTQKNLTEMFKEINSFINPEKVIVLFDEIDALALNRTSSNDLREMGRVTSTLLKCLDRMNENVVLVATTNLFNMFDKALSRRFDSIIDFNRYT